MDLFRAHRDVRVLPRVGHKAAMLVKSRGPFIRREYQRSNAVGHLINHLPQRDRHVDGTGDDDVLVGLALLLFYGHKPGRLNIPQPDSVQDLQVGYLDLTQHIPSLMFAKRVEFSAAFGNIGKTQAVRSQLGVQGG